MNKKQYNPISKIDGVIALGMLVVLIVGTVILSNMEERKMLAIFYSAVDIFFIFIVIKLRNQSLSTIGFNSGSRPYIIFSSLVILVFIIGLIKNDIAITLKFYYILLISAFMEELFFRGFMHARIKKLFNENELATIIFVGAMFGMMHGLRRVQIGQPFHLYHLTSEIGGGILAHFCFNKVYTKTGNICYSIILHWLLNSRSNIIELF